ncbi:hypothetical protein BKA70DRAFT_1399153 [Coprinopsis sp. MPI-PUGE-AT-0042]|nr:hypothetical protein BKA70DRAFT_1399153 [Coprinopsis sp. MPI-PUGE-AT-0042]
MADALLSSTLPLKPLTMPRKAYPGPSRKLLLAFDVGTTFSGISYSIMDPGQIPEVRSVTRYPGPLELVGADCKIPTEIYYDAEGNVKAVGAEASKEGIDDVAEDEGWTKAKWFKLHMRHRGQRSSILFPVIPPLPPNKTAVMVFADYIKYLYECAKAYIQETHANGESLWNSISGKISYVLTHPNGWEGPQHWQAQMREAIVLAGLINDDSDGRSRVTFVTEGEASLHFCFNDNLAPDALKNGEGIVIVDAGGGTVDVSAYKGAGNAFQETAIPQCYFQGSAFVTARAHEHVRDLLRDTDFEEDTPYIVERFDKSTKLTFKDESLPQYIKFGPFRETDASLGIRHGKLQLPGSATAAFFRPASSCIVEAVKNHVANGQHPISHVFLVGGFSASDWLYREVKTALERTGLEVSRPDSHVNKTVSDGAVAFILDHYVPSRISKNCLGVRTIVDYDSSNPGHLQRQGKVFAHSVTKVPSLNGHFSIIVHKNEQVPEGKEYRRWFHLSYKTLEEAESQVSDSQIVLRYDGELRSPEWVDDDPENFVAVCRVQMNIENIPPERRFDTLVGSYYTVQYALVIQLGVELGAAVVWEKNVSRHRCRCIFLQARFKLKNTLL